MIVVCQQLQDISSDLPILRREGQREKYSSYVQKLISSEENLENLTDNETQPTDKV